MAIVKMHKASDGSLHDSFEAFAKRERELKILAACDDAAFDESLFQRSEDSWDSRILLLEDLPKFIAANAGLLLEILIGATVTKRGRKTKAVASDRAFPDSPIDMRTGAEVDIYIKEENAALPITA